MVLQHNFLVQYSGQLHEAGSSGGSVDISANREFGQLMYDLIRGRFAEAGLEITPVIVTNLGNFLETAGREIRTCVGEIWHTNRPKHEIPDLENPPKWLDALVQWDPRTQLIIRTFLSMAWLSLLAPGDSERAVQVVPHTNKFFKERGYRELTKEETAHLTEQIITLHARHYPPRLLGAAGYALLTAVQRPLKRTPCGQGLRATTRRRKFAQEAWRLCYAVENTRGLAERKGHASLLGEKLEAELRASRATGLDRTMSLFWDEFNLFFSGSKLAK